ncbi:MAG: DUF4037 domain-containing protein [Actinomycetia bacterium]|nr:DUF4037 domain-containing protein [Actinomycetes bacterium]
MPGVGYLAARLGSGSDVLGYDDGRSADHDFGCRLTILVDKEHANVIEPVDDVLQRHLPQTFAGYPVRFAVSWDERAHHRVEIATVDGFAQSRLGVPCDRPLTAVDWLCVTGQSVLETVAGPVFADDTAGYGRLRHRLLWYPDDVWRYVLGAAWARLEQELPFVGRTGDVGDDVGSRLVAARLARDICHLAFLLERSWSPYPKWMGSALGALTAGPAVIERLSAALGARHWPEREAGLCAAIEALADRQRAVGLPTADAVITTFFDRPYRAVDRETQVLLANGVDNETLRRLPPGLGSIEQWCDNVDLLSDPARRDATRAVYGQFQQ